MEITISKEAYDEMVEIQVEEYEDGSHLCEQKLTVLFEHNVEADGALGDLLAGFDAFRGSGESHTTEVGYYDEDSDGNLAFDGLTVNYLTEDGDFVGDEYKILVEDGDYFYAEVKSSSFHDSCEVIEVR